MVTEGATRGPAAEKPKPALVRLFEAAAAVMDLDEGQTTLELHFQDGHLRRWTSHDSNNGHEALRPFDARTSVLVELLRAP